MFYFILNCKSEQPQGCGGRQHNPQAGRASSTLTKDMEKAAPPRRGEENSTTSGGPPVLCCVHKVDHWQVLGSHVVQLPGTQHLTHGFCACCSSAVCGSLYLLPAVRCRRPLDSSGHPHAACAVAGVLGGRGFAVESAGARVCREAGGRVSTNIRIQDMDIVAPNLLDERRVDVLDDAIDTTLVSALGRGLPGRWSQESVRFLVQLAKTKVCHEPKVMRVSAQCAWMRRWRCMLACAAAQAFALSLLERRAGPGSDGPTPTTSEWLATVVAGSVEDLS